MFSIAVRLPSKITLSNHTNASQLIIFIAAAVVIAAGLMRFIEQPSFWLDEAFVAVSLREPSPQIIFAPLEYGQYFPRIYLATIAALRETLGYQFWVLRLLPFLSFAIATAMWAWMLAKRARVALPLAALAAALLIGSRFWLDQAVQLKQYTLDVMLALIPFLLSDAFFKESLVEGRHKIKLAALAIPCLLSYTYPIVLVARLLGWYIHHARRHGWRVNAGAVATLIVATAFCLAGIWFTDYRFNINDRDAYLAYWDECIMSARLQQGIGETARLLVKYMWGWHGRMPLVTAGIVPLQILGVYSLIKRWKGRNEIDADDNHWGSRSLCSLFVLIGVVAASVIMNYPICGGRVVLFTQIHTQILALEGAILVLGLWRKRKLGRWFIYAFALIVLAHSARAYAQFILSEPAENLRPLLSLIKPEVANTVWVHPCSAAQVRALPDPLPVDQVLFGKETVSPLEHHSPATKAEAPQSGQKAWILWSHLSGEACRIPLEQIRNQARSWQVVHEGPDSGLALAEF